MRTLPIVVLLVLALALPGCQTTNKAKSDAEALAEAEAVYTYTDWSYGSIDATDGSVIFNAWTISKREGSATTNSLLVNMSTGRCSAPYFRVTIGQEIPWNKEFRSQQLLHGEIRIDDNAAFPFDFKYIKPLNKKYIWFDVYDIIKIQPFYDQLFKGQMIRFQVTVENKAYNLRFTLRNHIKALKQALGNCEEATAFKAGTPPKPGAPPAKAGGQDDDARYFKK